MRKGKKIAIILVSLLVLILIFIRTFLGIFVIQPIGAVPDGTSIVYWRSGLNIPFVASADGMLEKAGLGVSLLGRGVFLGNFAEIVKGREIIRLPYYKSLYLYSTDGKDYSR